MSVVRRKRQWVKIPLMTLEHRRPGGSMGERRAEPTKSSIKEATMVGDKAIRVGQPLLIQYQKMVRVMYDFFFDEHPYCGATFWIIHEDRTAEEARAKKQADELLKILRGEHTEDTDSNVHKEVYDLFD